MPSLSTIALFLLVISSLSSNAFSQSTGIEQCSSNLLPLAPCAPFVQGVAPLPVQSCCDNLKLLSMGQPSCLCFLLNETTLSSFPINTTLALQLPTLCSLQMSNSTCTSTPLPSTPPTFQVPSRPKTNSTVAASPIVTVAPRSSIMGFGLHHNAVVKLNAQSHFMMMLLIVISSVLQA